jgi:hypothetical protein
MKTVINVYTKNIKYYENGSHPSYGLGDFIRGVITLLKLSKELNFNVKVDLRYNKISNFLINNNEKEYLDEVDKNLDKLQHFFMLKNLKEFIINSFINNDIITLSTNAWWNKNEITCYDNISYPLTIEEKNFIKNILLPTDELNKYIQDKIENIPKKYTIIHFRIGDDLSFYNKNIPDEYLYKYEDIFIKHYEKDSILISDNKYFKNYIKSKYDINIFDVDIEHIGISNNNNLDGVKGSLFDFFIQSNAIKIKSFSIYFWISGFIHWNSKIYDIPLEIYKI